MSSRAPPRSSFVYGWADNDEQRLWFFKASRDDALSLSLDDRHHPVRACWR